MVVHDRSYSRWDGDRTGKVPGAWVILDRGVMTGLAVLFKRKIFAVLLTLWAFGPFVAAVLIMYAVFYFRSTPELAEIARNMSDVLRLVTPTPDTLWGYLVNLQLPVVFMLCVLVGSGLIAEDRRTNALELYLSRPLGRFQYVTGKLAVIGFFLSLVTVVPAVIIVLVWMALGATSADELASLSGLIVKAVEAGAVQVLVMSLLILAASSLAKRARNATILFVGFLVVSEIILHGILFEVLGNPSVHLVSILYDVRQCAAWLLDNPAELDPDVPALHCAVVLLGWVVLWSGVILRRVRPVEVVA
ncbi:MAG: ABC transporter permease subunit [Planctomycetes bacterium]|nr:ABC transporter permease subunit [Planctomycetota bacterium]